MLKRLGRYFHGKGIGFSHEKWPAASGVNHHIALIRDKTAVTAVDMLWIDWFSGFNMTPPQQSIHPDCLQALHKGFQPEWYAGSRLRSGVNGATPEAHTVAVWLFLAEIAFVAGDFETGVRLASDCLAAFPNDFRVQDSVFRGRFYLKNGLPKKIGCELSYRDWRRHSLVLRCLASYPSQQCLRQKTDAFRGVQLRDSATHPAVYPRWVLQLLRQDYVPLH
jgi:hypothetical protein